MVKLDSAKTTALMKRQGLTSEKLARCAYLPPAHVVRALDDKAVELSTALKIACVLNVDIEDIVTEVFNGHHWYKAGTPEFTAILGSKRQDSAQIDETIDNVISAVVVNSVNKAIAKSFCADLIFLATLRERSKK